MIPPLTAEEYDQLVPAWAKELHRLKIPHVIGLPVYDVLYGVKYGAENVDNGIVVFITEYPKDTWSKQQLGVEYPNGAGSSSAGVYYVANINTPEGAEHVRRFKAGEPLQDFELPEWAKARE